MALPSGRDHQFESDGIWRCQELDEPGAGSEAALLDEISLDEPWALIEKFAGLTRLSGSKDEAAAVAAITARLDEWGVDYRIDHPTCLISLPGPATLRTLGAEGKEYTVKTPSFSPHTSGKEVEAELVYVPGRQAADAKSLFAESRTTAGQDLRGKIVMTEGIGDRGARVRSGRLRAHWRRCSSTPESASMRASRPRRGARPTSIRWAACRRSRSSRSTGRMARS